MSLIKTLTNIIFTDSSSETQTSKTITAEQATVLGVLRCAETPMHSKQRMQKYMFLIDESLDDKYSLYTWSPYDYGPYSKKLQRDVKSLVRNGFVDERTKPTYGGKTRYYYSLTSDGESTLDSALGHEDDFSDVMKHIKDIVSDHKEIPLSNLMYDVLKDHPEYNKTVYKPTI
jgi:uncharacterized protein YwgA